MESFGTVLQAPDVSEARIGTRHQLARHYIRHHREVETAPFAGKRYAVHTRFGEHTVVLCRARGVDYMVVYHARSLLVDTVGVDGYGVAAYLAHYLEYFTVAVYGILVVDGGVIVFVFFCEVALFECHYLLHQRVVELELQIFIVKKKIGHNK